MKTLCTLFLLCGLTISSLQAQINCNSDRYYQPKFQEVKITKNVQFGAAPQLIDVTGSTPILMTQNLFMDIYEPAGDTETKRPMMILAFGGAFVYGARTDDYMIDICTRFAKLGYVTASIDYRLTRELAASGNGVDTTAAPRAVLKGTHDMKAAIRFIHKSIANGNPLKLDPNYIFTGGLSAGAFTAIHAAYLDKMSEVPNIIKQYVIDNGGIEGNSGNPEYPSTVAGVISFSGAIGDTAWIEPGNVPIVSTHGTSDDTVPYGSDSVTILGINYPVDGSSVVHHKIKKLNIPNSFYTYKNAEHAMESSSVAYRDTGFAVVRDFIYELVCNRVASSNNTPNTKVISIYPNPSNGTIHFTNINEKVSAKIYNALGQMVFTQELNPNQDQLSTQLGKGLYFIRLEGQSIQFQSQLVIE